MFKRIVSGLIIAILTTGYSFADSLKYKKPLVFQQSLVNNSGTVNLSGDSTSPGNIKCYSTNSSGVKGWNACSTGDVVGPSSSTDNHVVLFNGTTGKLIKDSGLTLSGNNTGDQDLSGYLTSSTATSTYEPLANLPSLSVDNEIVLYSGTGGKTLKRASGTGFAYATAGVVSYVSGTSSQFVKANGALDSSVYLTGNQSITWTAGGDVSGSNSGTTSISPSLTVTGVQGKAISLATGYLKYTGSAWSFDNSTFVTTSRNVTINGTSNQVTSSAGAQDLSADRTWTLSLTSNIYTDVKCANIDPSSTTTNWILPKAPVAWTITGVDCIVDASTSVVLTPQICNSNAASCSNMLSSNVTCGTTNTAGTISSSAVSAGNWIRVTRGTVSGSPTQVTICFKLTH